MQKSAKPVGEVLLEQEIMDAELRARYPLISVMTRPGDFFEKNDFKGEMISWFFLDVVYLYKKPGALPVIEINVKSEGL